MLVEGGCAMAHGEHGLDVCESALDLLLIDLESRDRFPELLAVLGIGKGSLQSPSCAAGRQPGYEDARVLKDVVCTRSEVEGILKPVLLWYEDVFHCDVSARLLRFEFLKMLT